MHMYSHHLGDPQQRLQKLLTFARANSAFYKAFYAEVPRDSIRLKDYPLLDGQRFWAALLQAASRLPLMLMITAACAAKPAARRQATYLRQRTA